MKKMLTRTALVASLMLATAGLSACGSGNDNCPHAAADSALTATTAMFPARGGGGGGHSGGGHSGGEHGSTGSGEHGTTDGSHGSNGFVLPHIFGGSDKKCQTKTTSNS